MIDEVWIINAALTEAELSAIALTKNIALNPVPENGAGDVWRTSGSHSPHGVC